MRAAVRVPVMRWQDALREVQARGMRVLPVRVGDRTFVRLTPTAWELPAVYTATLLEHSRDVLEHMAEDRRALAMESVAPCECMGHKGALLRMGDPEVLIFSRNVRYTLGLPAVLA